MFFFLFIEKQNRVELPIKLLIAPCYSLVDPLGPCYSFVDPLGLVIQLRKAVGRRSLMICSYSLEVQGVHTPNGPWSVWLHRPPGNPKFGF